MPRGRRTRPAHRLRRRAPRRAAAAPTPGARTRHPPEEQAEHGHGDREVQEERPAPREVLDQPAAEDGPEGGGDRAGGRPRPDGEPSLLFGERRAQDGEAARHEERRTHALHRARDHELPHTARQPAGAGRRGEEHDPARIDATPAEPISQRAADQQERGEKERVRLDDPLDVGDGGAELALQRRQGQVDDRAVDEGEARAEHRRGQHPRPSGLRARRGGACRKDYAFVTRGLEDQRLTR